LGHEEGGVISSLQEFGLWKENAQIVVQKVSSLLDKNFEKWHIRNDKHLAPGT